MLTALTNMHILPILHILHILPIFHIFHILHTLLRKGVEKKSIFLGKSPKLWVGGGQES